MILKTERLRLRELEAGDFANLCRTLQDEVAMAAYEHAFSDAEVRDWLNRQLTRYRRDGFGLWAVLDRNSGEFLGQCGLTWQDWRGRQVLEVGYLLERRHWGHGYATEAARRCMDYAFEDLSAEEVFSIIRDSNFASQRVALRNGMRLRGEFVKHYWGVDMPHWVYSQKRTEAQEILEKSHF